MNEKELLEIIKKEVMKYLAQKNIEEKIEVKKTSIQFIGADTILKNDIESVCDIAPKADKIVVSELGIKDMIDLSMGNYNSENSKDILFSILEGKEVIVSKEGIEWRKISTIPFKLQAKYEENEKELLNFGVKFIERMNIKSHLENKSNYFTDKILDMKTLRNNFGTSGSIVTVGKNTIVTELAKEYSMQNNIKIVKR